MFGVLSFDLMQCLVSYIFKSWFYVFLDLTLWLDSMPSPVHPILFMLHSSNGWNIFPYADGAVFDASQYAFFGSDSAVQEVELGGLEEDDDLLECNGEFIVNREEVNVHNSFDFNYKFCFQNNLKYKNVGIIFASFPTPPKINGY